MSDVKGDLVRLGNEFGIVRIYEDDLRVEELARIYIDGERVKL